MVPDPTQHVIGLDLNQAKNERIDIAVEGMRVYASLLSGEQADDHGILDGMHLQRWDCCSTSREVAKYKPFMRGVQDGHLCCILLGDACFRRALPASKDRVEGIVSLIQRLLHIHQPIFDLMLHDLMHSR